MTTGSIITSMPAEGFVLAGGASSRMGREKALLDWHGRPLLQHVVELLMTVAFPVRAVGRDDFPDLETGLGPMGGVLTALAASGTDFNFIVAVDLPLLTRKFIKYFAARSFSSSCSVVACKIGSDFPLLLAVRRSALSAATDYVRTGRRSVRGFIEESGPELVSSDDLQRNGFSLGMFQNLNTMDDYRLALERNL